MALEYITLKELAAELSLDRSRLRRYVLGMGIEPMRVRTPDSRNQKTLAVTRAEAKQIRNERKKSGFSSSGKVKMPEFGEFYIVVPDPEARPNRLKVGYSDNLEGRMATYRTNTPGVELVAKWPCKPSWEQAAIAVCANTEGTEHVKGEVYDVHVIDDARNRCNQFFSLVLPD